MSCWSSKTSLNILPSWSHSADAVTDLCVDTTGHRVVAVAEERSLHLISMLDGGGGGGVRLAELGPSVACQASVTAGRWRPGSTDVFGVTLLGSESVPGSLVTYTVRQGRALRHEYTCSLPRSSFWTFEVRALCLVPCACTPTRRVLLCASAVAIAMVPPAPPWAQPGT